MSNNMERLEEILDEKNKLESQLEVLEDEEKTLREDVRIKLIELEAQGDRPVIEGKRFVARLSRRKDYKVVDEPTVRTFLETNGLLQECLKLNLPAVKTIAKAQYVPGMEETESDVLTVSEKKEKVMRADYGEPSAAAMMRNIRKTKEKGEE